MTSVITVFRDSYGYDCSRRRNLCVLDADTLLFVTGNMIHFLDIEDDSVTPRRSVNGAGITCVAVSTSSTSVLKKAADRGQR